MAGVGGGVGWQGGVWFGRWSLGAGKGCVGGRRLGGREGCCWVVGVWVVGRGRVEWLEFRRQGGVRGVGVWLAGRCRVGWLKFGWKGGGGVVGV